MQRCLPVAVMSFTSSAEPPSVAIVSEPIRDLESQTALVGDLEFVQALPITRRAWLAGPIVVALFGAAGASALLVLIGPESLHLAGWMVFCVALLLMPFSLALAVSGWRAYRSMSVESVRALLSVRWIGLWTFSFALLVCGIVGGIGILTLVALTISEAGYFAYGRSYFDADTSHIRAVIRRLRPWFIIECGFALAGPPIALLIASIENGEADHLAGYVSNAILIPAVSAVILIFMLRRIRTETTGEFDR